MRKIKNSRWKAEDLTPLASLRFKAGYSREQAAVNMQISNTTLFHYENGVKDIPFSIVNRMTEIYNVTLEDIKQAVLDTKKTVTVNKTPKTKPLSDGEFMKNALKSANNIKEATINA